MKKKLISCLCVVALAMTMFPMSAFATPRYYEEDYGWWQCPGCHEENELEYEGDDYGTCAGCGRIYEQCPSCCDWVWWRNVNWENGICPYCGYEQWHHDVRANLRNQVYAYGQSNRIIVDVTYDVNQVTIHRINPNGSIIEVACFDPWDANGYWETENRNYDYSVEYWDYGLKNNKKYKYFVDYALVIEGSGESIDCDTTKTKAYWTAPKAKASNVKKNGSKVTWTKVSGADGYRVTFKKFKNIGYHQWWLTNRNQWTTKNSAYRKLDPHPNYKYERVGEIRAYAKHGDKYYAHGKKVRTVKKNLFI